MDNNVKVWLDMAIVNGGFSDLFADCIVDNIITTSSDHYAILITLAGESRVLDHRLVQHGFRFEAMWLRAPDYKDTLETWSPPWRW
jgi:hypothetical protein